MLFQFEDFEIDPVRFELRRSGSPVAIPRLVFDLILYLVQHRDRPVTKAELLEHVWTGRTVTEASLTQTITAARRALGDTPDTQHTIRTVHGRGYWWVAETTVLGTQGSAEGWAPLVGRASSLQAVLEELQRARRGEATLIRVIGEAGIGKTRFANEVAAAARASNFTVLLGSCPETDGETTRSPWIDVLSNAPQSLRSGKHRAVDNGASRLDLFEQVPVVLQECLRSYPTLVVFDDFHRVDHLSLRLLESVLRELSHLQLAVLVTCREPLDPADKTLGSSRARTIALGPLGLCDIEELIQAAPGGASRIDASNLLKQSGGNPFFATELIRAVGTEECDAGGWAGRRELPATIRDAVNRQTSHLPAEGLALLMAASVIGREFELSLLAEIHGCEVDGVLANLDRPLALGLVEERVSRPGVCRFRHVLVRDAVYSQVPRLERSRLHLSVADGIRAKYGEGEGPHLLRLAHHLRAALPLGDANAVARACVRAAQHATRSLEPEAAIACCRETMSLLEESSCFGVDARVELSIELAIAEMKAGSRKTAKEALARAQNAAASAGNVELVARAALAIAPGFFSIETGVVDWDLIATLEHALASLPNDESLMRAQLLGRLAQALYWSENRDRVEYLVHEAERTARRIQSGAAVAHAAVARFGATWGPGTLGERSQRLGELAAMTRALGDAEMEMMSSVFRFSTFLELGRREKAEAELQALKRLATHSDCVHGRWYPPMYESMMAIAMGRFADAEALIQRFNAIGRRLDDANVTQTSLLQLTEILWQSGRAGSMLGAVAENISKHPSLHEWQGALAFLCARAGRTDEARERLRALAGTALPGLSYRMNAVIGLAALAEVAWQLCDEEAAEKLRSVLDELGERTIVAGYGVLSWGSTARLRGHVAGILSQTDEAEFWYRRAIVWEARTRNRVWRARTQLAYARLLLKRSRPGDDDLARGLLARVATFAEGFRLTELGGEVADARNLRSRPRKRAR